MVEAGRQRNSDAAKGKGVAFQVPKGYVELTPDTAPGEIRFECQKARMIGGHYLAPPGHKGGKFGTIQILPDASGEMPAVPTKEKCQAAKVSKRIEKVVGTLESKGGKTYCLTDQTAAAGRFVSYFGFVRVGEMTWTVLSMSKGESPTLREAARGVLLSLK